MILINATLPLNAGQTAELNALDTATRNKITTAMNKAQAGSKIYIVINELLTSAIIHTPTNQAITVL